MVQINIEKKHLFILMIVLSLFTIALVIAVNPTTKPNPGHASNEVMINIGGADKTLQAVIDDGSLGGGAGWTHTGVKVYDNTPTGGVWTDLDLSNYVGKRNSLVFLKVENAFSLKTRVNGEQADIGQAFPSASGAGAAAGQAGTGTIIYLAIETDNLGVIEFNSYNAENIKIWLLGYV